MHIEKDLLIAWGARARKYKKNEFVYNEGDEARYYYQISEGMVRMFNVNDSAGKEFTQGMFGHDNSFGEPALITGEPYAVNAICITDCVIMLLPRENFLKIIHEYPDIHFRLTFMLAQRVWEKSITFKDIISNTPATRIMGFLSSYKKKLKLSQSERIHIPLTRQEIANFVGLRVETTIRTLNKLKDEGQVEIRNRRLFY